MCLALYKPASVQPNWDALKEGMESNSDGAGFAVAKEGQLIIEKGFFKWEDFRRALEPFSDCAAIIHFRLATHGGKNQQNCHPFALADFGGEGEPVAVIHNGIFGSAKNDRREWSDTWHVCRDVLHPLWLSNPKCFMHEAMKPIGDGFVGSFNKLVFLSGDGDFGIWGEGTGHWHEGCWWSNHSYECVSQHFGYCQPRSRTRWDSAAGKWLDKDNNPVDWDSYGITTRYARPGPLGPPDIDTDGTMYDKLPVGAMIEFGDELWSSTMSDWRPVSCSVGRMVGTFEIVRRAVNPASASVIPDPDEEAEEAYEEECRAWLTTSCDRSIRGEIVLDELLDCGVYSAAEIYMEWEETRSLESNVAALERLLAAAYDTETSQLEGWIDREVLKRTHDYEQAELALTLAESDTH